MPDLSLKPTVGLASGLTIQFAEGRWREEIGEGVAISEEAFDLVAPHLRSACAEWTDMHRYGAFELTLPAREALVHLLRSEAARRREVGDPSDDKRQLLDNLADWLVLRCDESVISILGI